MKYYTLPQLAAHVHRSESATKRALAAYAEWRNRKRKNSFTLERIPGIGYRLAQDDAEDFVAFYQPTSGPLVPPLPETLPA